MTPHPDQRDPYVGPRPFEQRDTDYFFGRDREISDVLSLIIAHRALLLYAQSGAGKTSLLNAGVIPKLRQEDFEVLPITRVRGLIPADFRPGKETNPYLFNTLISWQEDEADLQRLAQLRLTDFLKDRAYRTDQEGVPLPYVAIFDQFEEVFTAYPEYWTAREDFFKQVGDALDQNPYFRAVFVIREEYLGQLDRFMTFLPDNLRVRYRLERLRKEAALLAVTGPLVHTGRTFAEGIPEQLVDEMLKIRVETREKTEVIPGEYVEPVQLQVVCQTLWRSLPPDVQVITQDQLKTFGDVNQALSQFYEQCIKNAVKRSGVKEGDLRSWFENALITPSGTRGTVYRGREETGRIPNQAVDELENQHLIMAEYRAGARWHELTHDRFISPIQKSNEKWYAARQRVRAFSATAFFVAVLLAGIVIIRLNLQAAAITATETQVAIGVFSSGAEKVDPAGITASETRAAIEAQARDQAAAFQGTIGAQATIETQVALTGIVQTATAAKATIIAQATLDVPTNTPLPSPTPAPLGFTGNPVNSNVQWMTVSQSFNGVDMVLVPAGCFMMGSDQGELDELPVSQQCFDTPFWIDRYEVTNEQFEQFGGVAERNSYFCDQNQDGNITAEERTSCNAFPRESVTWFEARDFCALRGARLPTEAEWEYAARGPDSWIYPWGNEFAPDKVVYSGNSPYKPEVVGSKPKGISWVGAFDMSGNVWEWVSTIYGIYDFDKREFTQLYTYPYTASDRRENIGSDDYTLARVLRGSSFGYDAPFMYAANRLRNVPENFFPGFGFRCARTDVTAAAQAITQLERTALENAESFDGNNVDWRVFTQSFRGVEMALVPAGCFMMGSDRGELDELPVSQQCFDTPFWIDRYEVTNEQFEQFGGVAERNSYFCDQNQDGNITAEERTSCMLLPRDNVTWYETRDFCALRGARLPTEAEWEYAAHGPDNLIFPWGNEFVPDNAVYKDNSQGRSAPVVSRPGGVSWVGAFDMSGNVWEWVSTIYDVYDYDRQRWLSRFSYPYSAFDGRELNSNEAAFIHVLRGGSLFLDPAFLRTTTRGKSGPDGTLGDYGFRCARSN